MTYRQKPRLREEIRSLMSAINGAPSKPTESQSDRTESLEKETKEAQEKYEQMVSEKIASLNKLLKEFPQVITRISKP
jgi:predicted translin family RNA/ssDNA-binding protein